MYLLRFHRDILCVLLATPCFITHTIRSTSAQSCWTSAALNFRSPVPDQWEHLDSHRERQAPLHISYTIRTSGTTGLGVIMGAVSILCCYYVENYVQVPYRLPTPRHSLYWSSPPLSLDVKHDRRDTDRTPPGRSLREGACSFRQLASCWHVDRRQDTCNPPGRGSLVAHQGSTAPFPSLSTRGAITVLHPALSCLALLPKHHTNTFHSIADTTSACLVTIFAAFGGFACQSRHLSAIVALDRAARCGPRISISATLKVVYTSSHFTCEAIGKHASNKSLAVEETPRLLGSRRGIIIHIASCAQLMSRLSLPLWKSISWQFNKL
ncbi:hypothetical protein CALCODRAFT_37663 [Calocera cornea HHB12733]|uniref:Secreted protein n=1 Tax=Calocera cornea HHB12733 TaxID=1353952 RepID=A0A165DXY5_9BASI|nr:hypothetical protein CALCODRAFT_37663 [Calocera cornea HHB12733]